MKVENGWKELGDSFDGAEISISHEEFRVFHKILNKCVNVQVLEKKGFTRDEIRIAMSFRSLY